MSARALAADSLVPVRLVVPRRAAAAESSSVILSEITSQFSSTRIGENDMLW